MLTIQIREQHISLAQALKLAGLADSGGMAKQLVREGRVTVNGIVEKQPGKKLTVLDTFGLTDGPPWAVSR